MRDSIWRSNVNAFLAFMFVGSVTLGAGLLIWHAAFGHDPIADLIYNDSIAQAAGGF